MKGKLLSGPGHTAMFTDSETGRDYMLCEMRMSEESGVYDCTANDRPATLVDYEDEAELFLR